MSENETRTHETIDLINRNTEQENVSRVDLDERIKFLNKKLESLGFIEGTELNHEYQDILENIDSKGGSFEVMRDALERLQRETNSMHDWIENGVYFDLINANVGTSRTFDNVEVKWGQDRLKSDGLYEKYYTRISMKDAPPSFKEVLKALAKKGRMPGQIRTLGHEVNHSFQDPMAKEPKIKRELIKTYIPRIGRRSRKNYSQELDEAHARRFADSPPGVKTPDYVVGRVLEGKEKKGFYNEVEKIRMQKAVELIDKLNALSIDSEEVGKIVQDNGGWDENDKTYPNIEQYIKKEQSKLNLSDEDLEKLVRIDEMERGIERQKVMKIVQEELKKWQARQYIEQIA